MSARWKRINVAETLRDRGKLREATVAGATTGANVGAYEVPLGRGPLRPPNVTGLAKDDDEVEAYPIPDEYKDLLSY